MILRWTDGDKIIYGVNRLDVARKAKAASVVVNPFHFQQERLEDAKTFLQEGRQAPGA